MTLPDAIDFDIITVIRTRAASELLALRGSLTDQLHPVYGAVRRVRSSGCDDSNYRRVNPPQDFTKADISMFRECR